MHGINNFRITNNNKNVMEREIYFCRILSGNISKF